MKTLNSVVAAVAMSVIVATPVMASSTLIGGDATWGGSTTSFANSCTFDSNTAGTMTLNGNLWTVNSPAIVKLTTRNIGNVKVESDGKLRLNNGAETAVADVAINYATSSVTGGPSNASVNINTTNISIGNLTGGGAKSMTINIDGTATMTDTNDLLSNTSYVINHEVTCTQ